MSRHDVDLMSGRVLGPIAVVFVFVVLIVVSRVTSTDEASVDTTFAFVNTTSTTVATSTTTQAPTTSTTQPTDTPIATAPTLSYAPGWTGLPPNDLEERRGFAAVETGDRIVVWGGVGPTGTSDRSNGASYTFIERRWTPMASSPIVAGADPVAVMTDKELFVYAGAAAAWNPSNNTWRTLAYPSTGNTGGGGPIAGAWTGDQVILVGYRLHPPNFEDNLFVTSYGPDLGCCESYPDPPFSLTYGEAFWTGDEMLLIGALLDSNGTPKTEDGLGRLAGLDPVSGVWTEYEAPPLTGSGFPGRGRISAAWTGTRLIAWIAWGNAAEWTKDDGWRPLPGPPMAGDRCRPRTAAVGDDVFAMLCGQAAVWSDAAQLWYSISGPDAVNWSSDLCIPMALTPAGNVVDVWCSLDPTNAFWRIDLSKVEATRYSEPATLSQWELLPNPAATRLESTAIVWGGDELLYFSGQGTEVEEFRGWGYDPGTKIMHRIPDAPWPGRWGQVALWTGDEMLIQRGPTTL
ncbi:MAG: hypothetical protein ACC658_15700, partial [Acidimicrobiia bacterium]